jgi:tetratricopeptide (TPR) repeat protein
MSTPDEDQQKFIALLNEGNKLHNEDKLQDSLDTYVEAWKMMSELAPRSPDMALVYNQMGIVLTAAGQLDEARDYHEVALGIRMEQVLKDKSDIAMSANNLGLVEHKRGNFDEALEYYEKAVQWWMNSDNEQDRPHMLVGLENVYRMHIDADNVEEAQRYADIITSLGGDTEKRGAEQDFAKTYQEATELMQAGDLDVAWKKFEKALEIISQYGKGTSEHSCVLNSMGMVLINQGKLDEAEDYLYPSLDIRNKLDDSVQVAESASNLGTIDVQRGNLDKALAMFKKAVEIYIDEDVEHARLAKAYLSIANIYATVRELDEAQDYAFEARCLEEYLKDDWITICDLLSCEAFISLLQEDHDEAQAKYQEVLEIREAKVPDSPLVADALAQLGSGLRAKGDLENAKIHYLRAVAILKKRAPESNTLAHIYNLLGAVLEGLNEAQEALEVYRQSAKLLNRHTPESVLTLEAEKKITELEDLLYNTRSI